MTIAYVKQIGEEPFDLIDPYAHIYRIRDAVRGLSKVCRFNGHVTCDHYSVAQHMVLTSVIAESIDPTQAWNGLAHDLAEAYTQDIISPLKWLIRDLGPIVYARLRTIECAVENAYKFRMTDVVKLADRTALATEYRDLIPKSERCYSYWEGLPTPIAWVIKPLSAKEAEAAWWKRYEQLRAEGKAPKLV